MADAQWQWLANALTVEKLRELLPETAGLSVTRHLLPNLDRRPGIEAHEIGDHRHDDAADAQAAADHAHATAVLYVAACALIAEFHIRRSLQMPFPGTALAPSGASDP